MARRIDNYRLKRGDDLGDPAFWNRILEDLDLRLHDRELDGERLVGAIDALTAAALARLNDTFTPLVQAAAEQLQNVGARFVGVSSSDVTVGLGGRSFVLTDETRDGYVVTDYVVARPVIDGDIQDEIGLVGQVISYERDSGLLIVDVVVASGEGSYSDWQIRLSAPPDLEHAGRTDNPHEVTAEQVGAPTIAAMELALSALASTVEGELSALAEAKADLVHGHAATAISYDNTAGHFGTAADVQAALVELGTTGLVRTTQVAASGNDLNNALIGWCMADSSVSNRPTGSGSWVVETRPFNVNNKVQVAHAVGSALPLATFKRVWNASNGWSAWLPVAGHSGQVVKWARATSTTGDSTTGGAGSPADSSLFIDFATTFADSVVEIETVVPEADVIVDSSTPADRDFFTRVRLEGIANGPTYHWGRTIHTTSSQAANNYAPVRMLDYFTPGVTTQQRYRLQYWRGGSGLLVRLRGNLAVATIIAREIRP